MHLVKKILVIGSLGMDFVAYVRLRFPSPTRSETGAVGLCRNNG